MQRRSLFFVIALVFGAFAWVLWSTSRSSSNASEKEAAVVGDSTNARADDAAPKSAVAIESPLPNAPTVATDRVRVETSTAADAPTLSDQDGIWFAGTLVFPPNTPLDEHAQILCFGDSMREPVMKAAVGANGSFRVGVPKGSKKARIRLDAHYLVLDETRKLDPTKPNEPLKLEPKLGGWLVGRAFAPTNAKPDERKFEKARVSLQAFVTTRTQGGVEQTTAVQRTAAIEADGNFDFGAISENWTCTLESRPSAFARFEQRDVKVKPGERREIEIQFRIGGRASGRVLDEKGAPVVAADVYAQVARDDQQLFGRYHDGGVTASSDRNGNFDLRGLSLGKLCIVAESDGYAPATSEPIVFEDGDEHVGLALVLRRGSSIAGRVTWPDGTPAAKCSVHAQVHDPDAKDFEVWEQLNDTGIASKTDADGRFTIVGLGKGPFRVRAQAERIETASTATAIEASAPKSDAAAAPKKLSWRAEADRVPPNATDVALVLAPPFSISGRVVDDVGAPVKNFNVHATRYEGDQDIFRDQTGQSFATEDGRFEFERLHVGEWKLVVDATDNAQSDPQRIKLPGDVAELTFVCSRVGSVAGVVRSPNGTAIAGASIQAQSADNHGEWRSFGAVSDANGAFEVKKLKPGRVNLSATKSGFAPSERVTVEVASTLATENVVLELRAAGRVEGEIAAVLLKSGSNWTVSAQSVGGNSWSSSEADPTGRFTIDDLAPGNYVLFGYNRDAESQRDQPHAPVEIVAGQTAHVVLGGEAKAPIQVTGRVTADAKPVADVQVSISSEMDPFSSSEASGKTDANGRYSIQIDGAGPKTFVFSPPSGASIVHHLAIPEGKSYVYDLALSGRRLSGRILGPDQKPLGSMTVSIAPDDATGKKVSQLGFGSTTTDENGAYSFEHLESGVYRVRSGGAQTKFGSRSRGALDLTQRDSIEGVDLVLGPPSSISGNVRTSDGKLRSGWARIRDDAGTVIADKELSAEGDHSHFDIEGLSEGNYSIDVFAEEWINATPSSVSLADGGSKTVEIELVLGASLTVALAGFDGKAIHPNVHVFDAAGGEVTSSMFVGNFGTDRTIQPIAPGTYRVTADDGQGHVATENVTLASGDSRTVSLKL